MNLTMKSSTRDTMVLDEGNSDNKEFSFNKYHNHEEKLIKQMSEEEK